ncbi:MAG: Na/Pi cotransporter family protein [Xanthomonadales bacterium]
MTNPFASFDLWSGLFGGLALFLFGMDVMTKALKTAAGDYMKDVLGRLTRNRFVGVGTGAFVTALMQSSSVTTVLLVGFISAGLMSMSQSVSVIIGANIGTTITAQILAFKVTQLALPIIAIGLLTAYAARTNSWRQAGYGLLGLGLLFYGMGVMSAGLAPLRSYEPFIEFMVTMQNPLLGAAIGAAFTAIIQASAATTGILIVLASQGLINLEAAIAIALGANIGTCVTAALASIGKPREAVRAAVVHTLFNVAGVLLWIGFIPQLAELARWLSPTASGLAGAERVAAEMPRQIANIHTFFNVANAVLFVGFTSQIARLVEWLVPDRPIKPEKALLPKHLDPDLLDTPSIALEAVRSELRRLGKRVRRMVKEIMPAAVTGTRQDLERVAAMDKVVDALHIGIIDYLGRISLANLSERQSIELVQLVQVANALEQIGDRIATGLVTSARKRIDEEVTVSPQTAAVLNDYHQFVVTNVSDAIKAVTAQDAALARDVRKRRKDFNRLSRDLTEYGLERLTADEPNRLNTFVREMEVMEIFESVFAIARRIAETQK